MKYLNLLIILTFIFCNSSFAYEELPPSYYLTEGDLYSMQFSSDGSYLAVGLSTGLRLYRCDSGELVAQAQNRPSDQVEISSDGRTIVGLFDRNLVEVWSFDGEELETLANIETEANLVAIDPDAKTLAISKDDEIFLWDLTTLEQLGKLDDEREPVITSITRTEGNSTTTKGTGRPRTRAMMFSPDGKELAVGSNRRVVEIWNVETRKIQQNLNIGRDDWIKRIAFSPNSKFLAVSGELFSEIIQIWNMQDGRLARNLNTNYRAERFKFDSDSQQLFVGVDNHESFSPRPGIQVWDVLSGKISSFVITDVDYRLNIAFNNNDKVTATFGNGVINFWDIQNAKKINSWQKNFTPSICNLDLSPNGRYFMSSFWPPRGKVLKIRNTENNQIKLTLGSDKWFTNAVFLDNESIMIIDALDYAARVDIRTGEKEKLFSDLPLGSSISGYVIALSPERKEVAIASNFGQIYIYNLKEPDKPCEELRSDDVKDGYIQSMAYSNDGRYLAVGMQTDDEDYGWVIIWKKVPYTTYEFKLIESRKVHNYSLYSYYLPTIAFSEDGRLLATAGYPSNQQGEKIEVKVWRVNGWKLLGHLIDAGRPVVFSFDSERLLTGSDEGGTLWDWKHKRKIATLPDAEYCWLSDNKEVLLTLQKNQRLAVWNIRPFLIPLLTIFGEIKQSALLQNYPNPFNPETWIPFRLAEDAQVSIQIYSSFGQNVTELSLGRLSAGEYVDKDKAVYWDGRNKDGEEVSSGVYFYQIQAGEWSETKKMVIIR